MKYPTAVELVTARPRAWVGRPAADRLAKRYVLEPSGCWRWTGSITGSGYGHFSIGHVYYQAHRLTYILHRGPIPDGLEPDHLCRNRWCVNPWHLELVTHAENHRRGLNVRLTPELAEAIRIAAANGRGTRAIARTYGVNHSTISRILNGLIWKPEPVAAEAVA